MNPDSYRRGSKIINIKSDILIMVFFTEQHKMAKAAILDSRFHIVANVDIMTFHRSMTCDVPNILLFMQLSHWNDWKFVLRHGLGF